MVTARRKGAEDSKTRADLLDAAQALMMEDGYAAVSSRGVANRLGLNAATVYYYFETMDDLLVTLFRRMADRTLERQAEVLASAQPLWGLWDLSRDQSNTRLSMEFIALAHHRESIKVEMARYSERSRRMQVQAVDGVLEGYGIAREEYQPVALMFFMAGITRYLLVEEAFGTRLGHAEAISIVEAFLRRLEGDRGASRRSRPSSRRAPSP
ncbi:MAG: TetR/AcrR family transcriptional regulator [Acidimicrobiales bacterium]